MYSGTPVVSTNPWVNVNESDANFYSPTPLSRHLFEAWRQSFMDYPYFYPYPYPYPYPYLYLYPYPYP